MPTTGHLVFLRRGTLFAVPFDPERLEVRGIRCRLLDTVAQALDERPDSDDVHRRGPVCRRADRDAGVVSGAVVAVRTMATGHAGSSRAASRRCRVLPRAATTPTLRLSSRPAGRLAVTVRSLDGGGLWVLRSRARGTLTPADDGRGGTAWPFWSPDGQRLVFPWLKDGRRGSLATQPPTARRRRECWLWQPRIAPRLRDTRWAALAAWPSATSVSWRSCTIENGRARVQPLFPDARTQNAVAGVLAGRPLAGVRVKRAPGRDEVYVRPYPGPGSRTQVSIDGGRSPAWHPTNGRSFFASPLDPAGRRR